MARILNCTSYQLKKWIDRYVPENELPHHALYDARYQSCQYQILDMLESIEQIRHLCKSYVQKEENKN